MTQTLDYYPFGAQHIATGSFSEQRRFIGEEYDPDTEFSYRMPATTKAPAASS